MSSNDASGVWDEFVANELDDSSRAELLSALEHTKQGRRYFTYNAFNILVDAETSMVIVEDGP